MAVAVLVTLLSPVGARAQAAPGGVDCGLPESNAEALVILNNSYPSDSSCWARRRERQGKPRGELERSTVASEAALTELADLTVDPKGPMSAGQRAAAVASTACRMSWVAASGWDTNETCEAGLAPPERAGHGGARQYVVIGLLVAALGLQNATVRRLAVLDTTTTVLTLTLTGLAADSWLAGGRSPRAGRRVAAVGLMAAGALVGALLLRVDVALPLLAAAVLVALAAVGSGSAGKSVPFALALTAEEAEAAEGVAVQPDGRSQVASGDPGVKVDPPGWPAITVSAEVCPGQGTKTSCRGRSRTG